MTEPKTLMMAELNPYRGVVFKEVEARPYDYGWHVVDVPLGRQSFCYYLQHCAGVWVPVVENANATVAFGDTEALAAEALRVQRLAVAERMAQDLARFREVTAGLAWEAPEALTIEDLEQAEARAYEKVRSLLMDAGRMGGLASEMAPAVKLLLEDRQAALDACNVQRLRAEAADEEIESLRGHIESLKAAR